MYPRECILCKHTYENKNSFYTHQKNSTCINRQNKLKKAIETNNINNGSIINNNNNSITNNINITVNGPVELQSLFKTLKNDKIISQKDIERLSPVMEMLDQSGYKNEQDVINLINQYGLAATDVLNAFSAEANLLTRVADINDDVYKCPFKYVTDKTDPTKTIVDTDVNTLVVYIAKKFWIRCFFPDLTDSRLKNHCSLELLAARSIRMSEKDAGYCHVRETAALLPNGEIADLDVYCRKKGIDLKASAAESCLGINPVRQEMLEEMQERTEKCPSWTLQRWDQFVHDTLLQICKYICSVIYQRSTDVNDVVLNTLMDFAEDVHMYDKRISITEKDKQEIGQEVINDGKRSLVRGWRVIAEYLDKQLEKPSARKRREAIDRHKSRVVHQRAQQMITNKP